MKKALALISAASLGAGLMYLFDPDRGKRRRALVRDRAKHASRIAADAAGKTQRELRNHFHGVVAAVASLFRCEEVTDSVLQARVRSKMGHLVSHPHTIEVNAIDGVVILGGPILTDEIYPLLESVAAIRGVKNIENRLEIRDAAAGNVHTTRTASTATAGAA